MVIDSRTNDAFVVFYPFEKPNTETLSNNSSHEFLKTSQITVKKEILQIQTSKSKGAAGTFSMALTSATNWKSKIRPGAWCFIYIRDSALTGNETSELDSGLKMFGIVKSVRRSETVDGSGKRSVSFSVAGEDFHSILNNPIYMNINLAKAMARNGSDVLSGQIILKNDPDLIFPITPGKIAGVIKRVMLGDSRISVNQTTGQAEVDGAVSLPGSANNPIRIPAPVHARLWGSNQSNPANLYAQTIHNSFQKGLPGALISPPGVASCASTWSQMQTFCNPIVNELYTDLQPVMTSPGKMSLIPTIVLRAKPFSSVEGAKLHPACIAFTAANNKKGATDSSNFFYTSKVIEHNLGMDLGFSDSERFNFFLVQPSYTFDQNKNQISLISEFFSKEGKERLIDEVSMNRYGSRPYVATPNYVNLSDPWLYTMISRDFFKIAHQLENGSVTLPGSGEYIPVGTNVLFKNRKWIGHVEQVNHSFFVNGSGNKTFRTQLVLTRVQNENGTPIEHDDGPGDSSQLIDDRGISTSFGKGEGDK
jgi:hypothetical protein